MSAPTPVLMLPEEILIHIFCACDVNTLRSVSLTCKRFKTCNETEIVWRTKWKELTKEFAIPFYKGCNFKEMCRRFSAIYGFGTDDNGADTRDLILPSQCPRCTLQMSCTALCLQEREEIIIFDFGSKTTWFKYASESTGQLSMHPTVSPFTPPNRSSSLAMDDGSYTSCPICNRIVQKRIASGALVGSFCPKPPAVPPPAPAAAARLPPASQTNSKKLSNAFSRLTLRNLHCFDSSTTSLDADEEDCVFSKESICAARAAAASDECPAPADVDLLDKPNLEENPTAPENVNSAAVPPVEVYKFLMRHMLRRNPFFQVKTIPFVICEPVNTTISNKIDLTEFLFTDMKVPGICFIPKSNATALYSGLDTCLVIDSGAQNTVVSPVMELQLLRDQVQHRPVGGLFLSQQLLECIRDKGLNIQVDETSLDLAAVKKECYLSYNFEAERRKKLCTKTVHVKSKSGYHEVQLSHELYIVAEELYLALDLATMVVNSVKDLPVTHARKLLSNIILTGGNCRLSGLPQRLTRDLRDKLPLFENSLRVLDHRLMTGRTDAVIGASYIRKWQDAHWITRQDYVLHGGAECIGNTGLVHCV